MPEVCYQKPIKVTCSDPETGEVLQERVIQDDYVLICAGNRYLKSWQTMGRTHMLAVAVAKPEDIARG
ncbi:MAG TPA: hypothetical protein VGE09_06345 [Pseudoxanthomonas sp.]